MARPPTSSFEKTVVALAILMAAGLAWVLTVAPPFVDLIATVALAMGWCAWLERHPDGGPRSVDDHRPGTGDDDGRSPAGDEP